ncbi:hypothetical protein, partial [Klebsiella pneumoniae]|uniref:hypothetical protein n=1 Tax=Klebsiella pneumoniae TaxID=573 RepID=UPI003EE054D0
QMKTKKIIIILLCIILAFMLLKAKKIYRYFSEQRYYSVLVAINLAKPCFDPYKKSADIFIQEGFDYKKFDNQVVLKSLEKITNFTQV